jgi:hypothetical protein
MSAVTALIRDVFRQARASGLTAALQIVALLTVVGCLTLRLDTTETGASLSVGFGSIPLWTATSSNEAIAQLHLLLAAFVADTLGILLALIWTAGFLPSFLESTAASVMLSKPTSRVGLLLARWFGVLIYVASFAVLFIGLTWLAIGSRTNSWPMAYWLAVPLMLAHFAVFYSFSALLAVMSRNATVCIVGSILFWALCWAMNYGRDALSGLQLREASAGLSRISEIAYWIMPKPFDFSLILMDALGSRHVTAAGVAFPSAPTDMVNPGAAILTSLAAGAIFLALAVYEFIHDEY